MSEIIRGSINGTIIFLYIALSTSWNISCKNLGHHQRSRSSSSSSGSGPAERIPQQALDCDRSHLMHMRQFCGWHYFAELSPCLSSVCCCSSTTHPLYTPPQKVVSQCVYQQGWWICSDLCSQYLHGHIILQQYYFISQASTLSKSFFSRLIVEAKFASLIKAYS